MVGGGGTKLGVSLVASISTALVPVDDPVFMSGGRGGNGNCQFPWS